MIEASSPKSVKPNRSRLLIAVGVVLAVAAVIAVVVVATSGGSSKSSSSVRATPVAATASDLGSVAAKLGHPLYWAGARAGFTYELTQASTGNVWVRYLPQGVQLGDPRANFLTVGTYPKANAFQSVTAASKRKGAVSFSVPGGAGGLAVQYSDRPNSVYLAFPGKNLLIEVYNPSSSAARTAVKAGQILPLG
ncbi:MAG: hypothetical protein ACXVRH_01195 [Thermoleophilaceae bacterium]